MPTYSPCQVTLALVDRVSYIDKGGEWSGVADPWNRLRAPLARDLFQGLVTPD